MYLFANRKITEGSEARLQERICCRPEGNFEEGEKELG